MHDNILFPNKINFMMYIFIKYIEF